jgi:hypothetical protein
MTNQRLPAIVDYSNPVHHRAGGQVAAEAGSLTFLATWGLNRPEPGHSYGGIGETLRGNRRIGAGSGAGGDRRFS